MVKGLVVFVDIRRCLIANDPVSKKEEEVDMNSNNFGRLISLMHSVFSTLHSKRGEVASDKICVLKSDLNLLQIEWKEQLISYNTFLSSLMCLIAADTLSHEMILSCTPKFHMLHDHVPDVFLKMNGFLTWEKTP